MVLLKILVLSWELGGLSSSLSCTGSGGGGWYWPNPRPAWPIASHCGRPVAGPSHCPPLFHQPPANLEGERHTLAAEPSRPRPSQSKKPRQWSDGKQTRRQFWWSDCKKFTWYLFFHLSFTKLSLLSILDKKASRIHKGCPPLPNWMNIWTSSAFVQPPFTPMILWQTLFGMMVKWGIFIWFVQ